MAGIEEVKLRGDSALSDIEEDFFGTQKIAEGLAETISSRIAPGGYCLGIEGKWGSGKTTLSNFIEQSIFKTKTSHAFVRFEPWLISDRSAMLYYFFGLIAKEVESILLEQGPSAIGECLRWDYRVRRLARRLRKYGASVADLSAITASAASIYVTSHALWVVPILAIGRFLSRLVRRKQPNLEELRKKVEEDLNALAKIDPRFRITVAIDDLDRLEPAESVELIRVVSKVANFDYLNYLIFFDEDILSQHIKVVLEVPSGHDYLEKIFQNVVSIPPYESFAIRRFFRFKLAERFPKEMMDDLFAEREVRDRKVALFELWAGRLLNTPRDAVRVVDGVALIWPIIGDSGDFFDLVWLQLIKVKLPKLHAWTKTYVSCLGAFSEGAGVNDQGKVADAISLFEILKEVEWHRSNYDSGLFYFLPGVKNCLLDGEKRRVYDFSNQELERFDVGRRLGGPSFWRLYFSFEIPSYSVNLEELARFNSAVINDADGAIEMLREFMSRRHDRKGHYVSLLMDRLKSELSSQQQPNLAEGYLRAFAEVMDEFAHQIGRGGSGRFDIWESASQLVSSVPGKDFIDAIEEGASINWLAWMVLNEYYDHQNSRVEENSCLMSEMELESAMSKLVARFENVGLDGIFKLPNPVVTLYCWRDHISSDEFSKLLNEHAKTDQNFLIALNGLRSWQSSSNVGVHYPLNKSLVGKFMDADVAKERLRQLTSKVGNDSEIREEATRLLEIWDESWG